MSSVSSDDYNDGDSNSVMNATVWWRRWRRKRGRCVQHVVRECLSLSCTGFCRR